jgi:hypothetical protein
VARRLRRLPPMTVVVFLAGVFLGMLIMAAHYEGML